MASVLIIDDNRAKSAFLKMALMRRRHQVQRCQDIRKAINPENGMVPDVVLINQATHRSTGWEIFNHFKRLVPDLPTMVYVLENNCFYSTDWICRAVEAVCEEIEVPMNPPETIFKRMVPPTIHPNA